MPNRRTFPLAFLLRGLRVFVGKWDDSPPGAGLDRVHIRSPSGALSPYNCDKLGLLREMHFRTTRWPPEPPTTRDCWIARRSFPIPRESMASCLGGLSERA